MQSFKLFTISAALLLTSCLNDVVSSDSEKEEVPQFKTDVMHYDSVVYSNFAIPLEATNWTSDDPYYFSSKSPTVETVCPPTGLLEVDLSNADFGKHRVDVFVSTSKGVHDTFTVTFTYRDTTVYDFAPLVKGNQWTYEHRYSYSSFDGSYENVMEYSLEVTEISNDSATIELLTNVLTESEKKSWSETVRLSTKEEAVNFSIEGIALFLNRSYKGIQLIEFDGKPFELYLQEMQGGSRISCFQKGRGLVAFSEEHAISSRESAHETVILKRFNGSPVDLDWIIENTEIHL